MSIIITGGAGFIGSCIVRSLNDRGIDDIIVVDNIASTEKWRNLSNKRYREYIHKDCFLERLPSLEGKVTHVIHMGACSATTERNFDYLYHNNTDYSKALWHFCTENGTSFLYASSAATYGAGENGFDDMEDIGILRPLNAYGYSKQLFDLWVQKQSTAPPQHAGFKFYNVYGPNEYCKGSMASVILHGYHQAKENGKICLFKSCRKEYEDGGQLRDFVYVKDICKVVEFFMDHPRVNGLFNVGTGCARSFRDLGTSVFRAMNLPVNIEYIPMPEELKEKYQYFTEAKIKKLRSIGFMEPFYSLEDGISDYVRNYLVPWAVY